MKVRFSNVNISFQKLSLESWSSSQIQMDLRCLAESSQVFDHLYLESSAIKVEGLEKSLQDRKENTKPLNSDVIREIVRKCISTNISIFFLSFPRDLRDFSLINSWFYNYNLWQPKQQSHFFLLTTFHQCAGLQWGLK